MQTILDLFTQNPILDFLLKFVLITLSASAYYSLFKYSKGIFSLLLTTNTPLTDNEQKRLDGLLLNAKNLHNVSFLLAGILIALSSLSSFDNFSAPFGEIVFPKLQAALGLFVLCIISLIISDRFYLLAYPWVSNDERRPPFDWIAMGLSFERNRLSSIIFNLPIPIAALGATNIIGNDPNLKNIVSFSLYSLTGFGLLYLPRTIYYWNHLIDVREDHRGGKATLSIYLLYWYRVLRQLLFSTYLVLPVVLIIPQWAGQYIFTNTVFITLIYGLIYLIRMICSFKFVYRKIDRLGLKLGFPVTSKHYK